MTNPAGVERRWGRLALHPLGATQNLDLSNPAVAPAGASQFNLVLAPGVLTPGVVYSFALNVTSAFPAGRGGAQTSFVVNSVSGFRHLHRAPRSLGSLGRMP